MSKVICFSPAKEQFDYKGNSLGMGNERALFYNRFTGKQRVYRMSVPNSDDDMELLTSDNTSDAQSLCQKINEAHNDDFAPLEI